MLPLVLGGIALAATGYKLKKHLDDDENYEKFHDSLVEGYEWIDRVDHKVDMWFDSLKREKDELNQGTIYDVDLSTVLNQRDIVEPLRETTYQLYKTLFRETEGVKRSIKNLRRDATMPLFDDLKGIETLKNTPDNQTHLKEFCHILTKAECVQYRLLDELEKAFSAVDDFEQLSDEDKVKAVRLIEMDELMHEACQSAITFDGVFVSRMAKRAFQKVNRLLA
jgi:hypothetical protein